MEDRTDTALIHRARSGDRQAFRDLVERHQDRVFGLAVTMLGNRTDAEDAAQEVFLKVYKNLAAFRGDARFGTWLYRMTVNACWDALRKRRRERDAMADVGRVGAFSPPTATTGGATGPPDEPSPPTAEGDQEVAPTPRQEVSVERVKAALAKLDVDDRAVLRLREVDGLAYEDVAATLGVTVEAVKSRLFRARERFREVWHETA